MKKFLNTALGSYLKVYLTLVLTYASYQMVKNKVSFFELFEKATIDEILTGAATAFIPIIINAWNSEDPRYGKKSKLTDLKADRKV